ncbi:hypothetical protein WDW86_01805 [Bdellovibrionota bacterium FG-2]
MKAIRLVQKFWMDVWKDERGQSTTEYILILSVVVMVALKFKTVFEKKLMGIVGTLGDQIDKGVQDSSP